MVTTKECPCHVYSDSMPNNWTSNNVQWNHQWLRSGVLIDSGMIFKFHTARFFLEKENRVVFLQVKQMLYAYLR